MSSSLGLGMVLSWRDNASRGIRTAESNLKRLKASSKNTAESFIKESERIQQKMNKYGKMRSRGLMVAGVGMAMAAPLIKATKDAATFEDKMNDVRSLLAGQGLGEAEMTSRMGKLSRQIKGFAGTSRVSLNEIADSAYAMVSALGDEVGGDALARAVDLSVAAKGTAAEGVQTMTSVLATFGEKWGDAMTPMEKANKVFNIISGSVAAFNTDLSKLSMGMSYATGPASSLGISLAETSAVIGMAQTKGLRDSMAGTSFSAALRGLVKLSEKKGFEKFAVKDAAGQMLPFWQILQNVEEALDVTGTASEDTLKQIEDGSLKSSEALASMGMSTKDAASMQELLGDEGSRLIMMLLGQSKALRDNTSRIQESTSGVDMLKARQSGLVAEWEKTKNKLRIFSSEMGQYVSGDMQDINESVGGLLDTMNDLAAEHPDAAKWAVWGYIMTSTLASVSGAAISTFGWLRMLKMERVMTALATGGQEAAREAAVGRFGRLFKSIRSMFASGAGKYGIVGLGAAAVGSAFSVAYDESERFKNMIDDTRYALSLLHPKMADFLNIGMGYTPSYWRKPVGFDEMSFVDRTRWVVEQQEASDRRAAWYLKQHNVRLLEKGLSSSGMYFDSLPVPDVSTMPFIPTPMDATATGMQGGSSSTTWPAQNIDQRTQKFEITVNPPQGATPKEVARQVVKEIKKVENLSNAGRN